MDTEKRLFSRIEALRTLIATAPASSLADVAVQLGTAAAFSGILENSNWTDPADHRRLDQMHAALGTVVLSVLPVVAAAAGLDMTAMAWDELDELRAARFFGGEARA